MFVPCLPDSHKRTVTCIIFPTKAFSSFLFHFFFFTKVHSNAYIYIYTYRSLKTLPLHSPWLLGASSSPFDSHGSRQLDYKVPLPCCQSISTALPLVIHVRERMKVQAEILSYISRRKRAPTSGKYFASISGSGAASCAILHSIDDKSPVWSSSYDQITYVD